MASRTIQATIIGRTEYGELSNRSRDSENPNLRLRQLVADLLPKFGVDWNIHSLVGLSRLGLSRILYYRDLYAKILDVPGVICEFGVQWGATLSLLMNLRGMLEPFNSSRTIFGFDTFQGFLEPQPEDGLLLRAGDYRTTYQYEQTLEEILSIQEASSPVAHIKRFQLIKGDASETAVEWANSNPALLVAMAIFDMDVYRPTRDVLETIRPRLSKGSLLVFDELGCGQYPGETAAVQEVLGINNLRLYRHPHMSHCAWAIFGE